MLQKKKNSGRSRTFSLREKWFLGLGVFALVLLSVGFLANDLGAQSTPTGNTTPSIFGDLDKCNFGLIGACDEQSQYVSGPESVLQSWIFRKGIPSWISYFLILATGIAVLMVMIGGVMISVGADSDLRKQGIKTITWALVGLLIALFAFFIVGLLENLPLPGSTAPTSTESSSTSPPSPTPSSDSSGGGTPREPGNTPRF